MVGALSDEHLLSLCSETKYSVIVPHQVKGSKEMFEPTLYFHSLYLHFCIEAFTLWDVMVCLQGLILSGHPSGLSSWQF